MDVPLGQMITDSKVNMSAVIGATSTNTIQGLEFQNLIKKNHQPMIKNQEKLSLINEFNC